MCLIVDANVSSLVFSDPPHEDFLPITKALNEKRACFVIGGRLQEEYATWVKRSPASKRVIQVLEQKGSIRFVSSGEQARIRSRTAEFEVSEEMRSDDPHILALAEMTGQRLLCSRDQDLHADFTNPKLLPAPKGAVYQSPAHQHLVDSHCRSARASQGSSLRKKRRR